MRIALAQINPTVGDIAGNIERHRTALRAAAEAGAELVVFPELSIIGYPPRDLLLKPSVIGDCEAAIEELAGECVAIAAIIGFPRAAESPRGLALQNAAAICADGDIVEVRGKSLLPTYDVFDETRYFEPAGAVNITELDGVRLGVTICEDLWNDERIFTRQLYHYNPVDCLAEAGAELLINIAASPYVIRKQAFRLKLMRHAAKKHRLPLIYCNQVGGNDELIFDGNSCVLDADGELLAYARECEEDLLLVELPGIGEKAEAEADASRDVVDVRDVAAGINRIEQPSDDLASAYHALVLGLRDYCRKCGFTSVVIGLSGGIDSAVTCAIAVAALGPANVRGISMPSRYSSAGSRDDATILAENLGIPYHQIPIEDAHAAFEQMLDPHFEGTPPGTAEENIQARCRGIVLMAMSNKFGSMLISTGNKSELAVGYCTLYGDMAGGLAVISDVPKMMVYDLARWINDAPDSPLRRQFGKAVIPQNTITKPPSAELKPDQKDEDSLPPYEQLDAIIERYVEREQSAARIIEETGFDAATVQRMITLIDRNEYKRKQAAPGLKITSRAFGIGRRMPIAQRYRPLEQIRRSHSD